MKHSIPSCVLAIVLIAACAPLRPSPSTSTAAIPSQDSEGELAARLDAYVAGQATNLSFTGSVLVARHGQVLLLGGFGAADRAGGLPNTAQTKFRVASITKQFTALAILILQARGELNVQDRACVYLPDCPPAWRAITIHQLLTHTSGIKSYKDLPNYPAFRATPVAPAELTARFRDLPLAFEPGTQYGYSNSGYVLLGTIIGELSGMPCAEFVKTSILDPLGMSATGFLQGTQGQAVGYEISYAMTPAVLDDVSAEYAAGGLSSTVADLYLFDQVLFTEQLLPADPRARMFTSYEPMPDIDGLRHGYGCQVGDMEGHPTVGHTGLPEGYSSMNAYFPDERVAVILLGNQRNPPVYSTGIELARMVLESGE